MARLGIRLQAAAAALLLATACGEKKGGSFTPPPVNVEVALAVRETVRETFEAVGTVEAAERVTVSSEIDALVLELPFQEGGFVRKGRLLARLNDLELRAEARRAEALRDQARLAFERSDSLAEQRIASSQDRDDARAALQVAEANLKLAEARLAKTRITAPFDGVVGRRLVSPGAFLRTGDVVTDLARMDVVKIVFAVPEVYLSSLRRGASVEVSAAAYPGKRFAGSVDVLDPILDPGTRSARLIARVRNPLRELRPGMSADVRAVLAERPGAVTIPSEAVFGEGDTNYVYRVNGDSTVSRQAIELGARQGGGVEVTQGLKEGERVVRAGHQKLFEGARIVPIEEGKEPSAGTAPPAGS